jgi:hypothetical protein
MFSMQRVVGGVMLATMVAGSAVAANASVAAKKHKPVVKKQTISYQGGCAAEVSAKGTGGTLNPGRCDNGTLTRPAHTKYLSITVVDQTGQPTGGEIWLAKNGANSTDLAFCGTLKNYVMGQSSYSLDLNTPAADSDCPGAATQGTITVTYSSVPLK